MTTSHVFAPAFVPENPFLASAVAPAYERAAAAEPVAMPSGEPCFALVQSGPPVPEEEVETAATAIEVTVRWGAQVLLVKHLGDGRSFRLGEGADFTLPDHVASSGVTELVARRPEGPVVVVPAGAHATITSRGQAVRELAAGEEALLAERHTIVVEAFATRTDGSYGEPVTFEIAAVRAGKVAKIGFLTTLSSTALGFIGASFLGHAAIVASMAMFMPAMGKDDADGIDRDQMLLMQKLLNASAERELLETQTDENQGDTAAQGGGGGGRHAGEEGKAGKTTPVDTHGRMGFKGKESESKISKADELRAAQTEGLVGLLLATSADPNAPSSIWSKDAYQGSDIKSAMGDLFSSNIDDAMGTGGLALNGTGEGGGCASGDCSGVGLDLTGGIGGLGRGNGFGIGKDKNGVGNGHGKLQGTYTPKKISMRPGGEISSNGRLPAEVIQRIVRQNFGRMRLCYENGLRGNPGLQGRVSTKFVIGRDGAVATSQDAGSDLPDQKVVSCVVSSFANLSFPAPEGGIATVVYPLSLSPGE